ncbi:MAG: mechanosensitive ion channel family protein [Salibacteraceae bacterium]
MRIHLLKLCLFLGVTIFTFQLGFSQEEIPEDSSAIKNALSIDQISSETESLRGRIKNLKQILKPNTQTLEIDSLLDSIHVQVQVEKDSLYSEIESLTRRELNSRKIVWLEFKKKMKSTQSILNERNEEVSEINEELVFELEKWTGTKTVLAQNTESEEVFASLDTMIFTLNDLIDYSHIRLDSLFKIEKKITELILIVDEAYSEIIRYERLRQKEYFVLDSPPFWTIFQKDTTNVDSLKVTTDSSAVAEGAIKKGLLEDYESLKLFTKSNLDQIVVQIVIILFIFILLLVFNHQLGKTNLHLARNIDFQIRVILTHPVSSALILGVLISSFFYTSIVPVFSEIQILLVLLASTFLLPRITHKRIYPLMILILLGFLIQTVEPYYMPRSTPIRWILLCKSIVIFSAIYFGRKAMFKKEDSYGKLFKVFRYLFPFFGFITVLSFLFNLIGMVNLSDILLNGVLISIALGLVVFLAVQIISNLTLFVVQLRKANHEETLSIMVEATTKRFQPIISWLGFLLWIVFTLKGFDFYDNLVEWTQGLLEIDWKIGETKISLGSILSFTGLLILSLLIAKLVASIFQDSWMLKVLPRGVAPATSLILRILVISIGVYVAFSAAGFDVGKLGIVFGALSVGIGFGLQNVVLNFIAGLILAFERPINLGDAIEIDNEMGEVTNIGVRSSNIRTYSGAEAIIPNGDLISKKVVNWTLANRDRRSKVRMRTSSNADPNQVIELFNKVANEHPKTFSDPAPKTYFYGYGEDGNLEFALLYWSSFSDTLKTNSEIALTIFNELKSAQIEAPIPNQRNFK